MAVEVYADRRTRPLVALSSPDAPTRVLSRPDVPGDVAAGGKGMPGAPSRVPLAVGTVDAGEGDRLMVAGRATAGAEVRLYLNGTLIAPARVHPDGTVTFGIGKGIGPGDYRVRLDEVDPATGKVLDRAEVPFTVPGEAPGTLAARGDPSAPAGQASTSGGVGVPGSSGTGAVGPKGRAAGTADAYVPEVGTARIARGDSLWGISRRTYGQGVRYTAIYDANQSQIRDPDLIYPGQVFGVARNFG